MSISTRKSETLRFLVLALIAGAFFSAAAWADSPLFRLSKAPPPKGGAGVAVEVDDARLHAATDRISFALDGTAYVAEASTVERKGAGLLWVGMTQVAADDGELGKSAPARSAPGVAAFYRDAEGRLYGVLHTGRASYQLWPSTDGGTALHREASGGATSDAVECAVESSSRSGFGFDRPVQPPSISGPGFLEPSYAPVEQRVLIVAGQTYTQNKGGVGPLVAWAELLVAVANQIYLNGGINLQLELAHVHPGDADWLPNGFSQPWQPDDHLTAMKTYGNGYFDEVPGLREQHAADLVLVLFHENLQRGWCGRADAILGGEDTAYAYVANGAKCLGPETFTFTHEAGHLQGAAHDTGTTEPDFARGYFVDDGAHPFRTVMATRYELPHIPYFSNPFQGYQGQSIGTFEAFNGYQIWLTRQTIAAYRVGDGSFPWAVALPDTVGGLSGNAGARRHYGVAVPASNLPRTLRVELSGSRWSNGNAEIYVREGIKPTYTVHDCAGISAGHDQVCEIQNPPAGTYRIMVRGGNGGYAGVTLDVDLIYN